MYVPAAWENQQSWSQEPTDLETQPEGARNPEGWKAKVWKEGVWGGRLEEGEGRPGLPQRRGFCHWRCPTCSNLGSWLLTQKHIPWLWKGKCWRDSLWGTRGNRVYVSIYKSKRLSLTHGWFENTQSLALRIDGWLLEGWGRFIFKDRKRKENQNNKMTIILQG